MLERDLVDEATRLLSTAIGMVMEDHVDEALTTGSDSNPLRLAEVGRDVSTLAEAISVLRRRGPGNAGADT